MVRAIDAAASGMISQMTLNDILANNLANINTPGFKQTMAAFKDINEASVNEINPTKGYETDRPLGTVSLGSMLDTTCIDFRQGGIKTTGNKLDLAVNGRGFFTVQTQDGLAYTRNGSFTVDSKGSITTTDGYLLMGERGPLTIDIQNSEVNNITVNSNGEILQNGQSIGKIKISDFNDLKSLQSFGNSLYKPSGNQLSINAENYEIKQGALETSNANVVETMVNSIQGQRTYEALAKVVETTSRSLNKSVNEVGRIKR